MHADLAVCKAPSFTLMSRNWSLIAVISHFKRTVLGFWPNEPSKRRPNDLSVKRLPLVRFQRASWGSCVVRWRLQRTTWVGVPGGDGPGPWRVFVAQAVGSFHSGQTTAVWHGEEGRPSRETLPKPRFLLPVKRRLRRRDSRAERRRQRERPPPLRDRFARCVANHC